MKIKPIIIYTIIVIMSCKLPTKTTPENTQELADCSAPGLTYNQPDSTSCFCIDNANWNADSTFCDCTSPYILNSDSTICHLDTTSHDFTWEIDTLGDFNSYISDIHIVDENDIWAVGNIEVSDSSHLSSYGHYNIAHWDGNDWEYKGLVSTDEMIWSESIIENYTSYSLNLHNILFFSNDDIWVTSNCYPKHWDGENWTNFRLNSHIGFSDSTCVGEAMWGTSSSNMYFVGSYGSIVHYNGSEFIPFDGMTEINLTSISGYPNSLWISGQTHYGEIDHGSVLIFYDGIEMIKLLDFQSPWDNEMAGFFRGIYSYEPNKVYLVKSGGNYWCEYINNEINCLEDTTENNTVYTHSITGRARNDIFYGGDFTTFSHYNGFTTKQTTEFPYGGSIRAMDVKDDLIIMSSDGAMWPYCLIYKGIRN